MSSKRFQALVQILFLILVLVIDSDSRPVPVWSVRTLLGPFCLLFELQVWNCPLDCLSLLFSWINSCISIQLNAFSFIALYPACRAQDKRKGWEILNMEAGESGRGRGKRWDVCTDMPLNYPWAMQGCVQIFKGTDSLPHIASVHTYCTYTLEKDTLISTERPPAGYTHTHGRMHTQYWRYDCFTCNFTEKVSDLKYTVKT